MSFTARFPARALVPVTVLTVVASMLTGAVLVPAAAASSLTMAKEGPGTILVGGDGEFTLTVSNAGDAPAYNVSFRDVLPAGVAYQGPTSPTTAGEPTVIANRPAAGQTTLIWQNAFDLNPGGTETLTYSVGTDAVALPVGATFDNDAGAYWSDDPRVVADFSATTGAFIPEAGVISQTGVKVTTDITAIRIEKSEPSPEHELVRGIHDGNGTTYTLLVTNNGENPTTDVVVVDYLPASLEFLQCGGVDNTAGAFVEYPGAPRLTATTAPPGPCAAPTSVETVNEDPPGTAPPGIYTKVTWTVPTLAAAATYEINYRAGVPLQLNTMDFQSRPETTPVDPTPSADCAADVCPQAANLDNNLGANTVETLSEASATNVADASGIYQGEWVPPSGVCPNPIDPLDTTPPCPAPVAVSDSTSLDVTIEDLAMQKSVSPGTFAVGGTATYTIDLQTSEYRSSESIHVVDTLPDGLTFVPGSTSGAAAFVPPAVGSGPTTLAWDAADIPAAGSATFSYQAVMTDSYDQTGMPTVAGDAYTNDITLTGVTLPIDGVDPPDPSDAVDVGDASDATIDSGGSSIDKRVGQDRTTSDCAANTYTDLTVPTFRVGDIVCFQLRVDFNAVNNTKSPFVTDFLPAELTYVPSSWTAVGPTSTVTNIALAPTSTDQVLTWTMGDLQGSGAAQARFVDQGAVFLVRFQAKVNAGQTGPQPDVTGNLMKFGSVNTDGAAITLRDKVDIKVAANQVAIDKSIYQVNGLPVPANARGAVDDWTVKAGDRVTWRTDVKNSAAAGSPSIRNVIVFDTLPTGITCADVSVTVADPDPSPPAWTCAAGVITWGPILGPIAANAWAAYPLLFDMTMPAVTPVSTTYTNRAQVTSYEVQANTTDWEKVLPLNVKDTSKVHTPAVSVTKSGTTGFEGTNNNTPDQFTVGETITYTVDGVVPARTTVNGASLSDTLPSELAFVSSEASYSPTGGTDPADFEALPTGTELSGDGLAISFGTSFANDLTTDSRFRLTITAVVLKPATTYTHGQQISNQATFAGTGFTKPSDPVTTTVVIPNPLLVKTNSKPASGSALLPGEDITFTLAVTNPQGTPSAPARPALYESTVVDTVPTGILVTESSLATGCVLTGDDPIVGGGTITCQVGTVEPDATVTITYTAQIAPSATGSLTYTNSATLTGYSLPDTEQPDAAKKGTYTSSDTSSVRTDNGSLAKTVSPDHAAVGQKATWTVTATIPADLEYFGAAIIDTLPTGVSFIETTGVACAQAGTPTDCAGTFEPEPIGADLTPSGDKVGWLLGNVKPSTSVRTVTITYSAKVTDIPANVDRDPADPLTNSATLNSNPESKETPTSAGGTFEIVGDPATADVVVVEPDLTVSKTVSQASPIPGAPYQYTITVTNAAGELVGTAYNATIVDVVPAGVIVDQTTLGAGGSCNGTCDQVNGGGTITWTAVAPIAPGGSASRTYTAKLRSSLVPEAPPMEFVNTATVPDYTSCDAAASTACVDDGHTFPKVDDPAVVTPGAPSADLAIVKTPSGLTTPGSQWTFHMAVSNLGPSDAEGPILVTDTMQDGMTYLSSGPGWACVPTGQIVSCTLEPVGPPAAGLAAGASAPDLVFRVQLASTPESYGYTNKGVVSSGTPDPTPSNNTSTAQVTVAPTPVVVPPEVIVPPVVIVPPEVIVPPVVPKPPVVPGITVQRPVRPLPLPGTIKPGVTTVILPGTVYTNAGQPIAVVVQCRPLNDFRDKVGLSLGGAWVPMGDIAFCQVRYRANGKVTVRVTYPGPVLVKVTLSAPAKKGYTAYHKVVRYVVRPHR